jgi:hypothetical protein
MRLRILPKMQTASQNERDKRCYLHRQVLLHVVTMMMSVVCRAIECACNRSRLQVNLTTTWK